MYDRFDIEFELLESLYWGNGYSIYHISNVFGCSDTTIMRKMIKYGIQRRVNYELTEFTFDDRQKEIFEGLMLGDGGLLWKTNNCCFRNTDTFEEYLIWLQKQLGVEDISRIAPVYYFSGASAPYEYALSTRVISSIREEHKRWYPYETRHGIHQNRQLKIIPKDIELTPIKMLFWYLGDGGYIKRDKTIMFYNSFVFADWEILSSKISKLLDVGSGIFICKHRKDKDDIQRYGLYLNKVATNKFFDMVDSLGFDIPECYQYKFGR